MASLPLGVGLRTGLLGIDENFLGLPVGKFAAIYGGEGAGKSTLLMQIAGEMSRSCRVAVFDLQRGIGQSVALMDWVDAGFPPREQDAEPEAFAPDGGEHRYGKGRLLRFVHPFTMEGLVDALAQAADESDAVLIDGLDELYANPQVDATSELLRDIAREHACLVLATGKLAHEVPAPTVAEYEGRLTKTPVCDIALLMGSRNEAQREDVPFGHAEGEVVFMSYLKREENLVSYGPDLFFDTASGCFCDVAFYSPVHWVPAGPVSLDLWEGAEYHENLEIEQALREREALDARKASVKQVVAQYREGERAWVFGSMSWAEREAALAMIENLLAESPEFTVMLPYSERSPWELLSEVKARVPELRDAGGLRDACWRWTQPWALRIQVEEAR